MAQVFAQGNEEKTLEFLEQNAANITDESLLERILHTYPTGLKFDKRFFENETLFRSAITSPALEATFFCVMRRMKYGNISSSIIKLMRCVNLRSRIGRAFYIKSYIAFCPKH